MTNKERIKREAEQYAAKSKYGIHYQTEKIAYIAGTTAERERERWIPVSERLPENNEYVLCLTQLGRVIENSYMHHTDQDVEWFKRSFTHWLPKSVLPSPPKE